MERRIQAGQSHYDPFGLGPADARGPDAPEPPNDPREGQLWVMPSGDSPVRFKDQQERKLIKAAIDEATGRFDTHVSPIRLTILQFRNGYWESLSY